MKKDVVSRGAGVAGYKGEESPQPNDPAEATPVATSGSPDAAGQAAQKVDGAASGSGQSTGFGNPGEQPDADPKGGDGSSLLAANLRKASKQ